LFALIKKISTIFLGFIICGAVSAAPNAHYLPLKSDPLIELELERLATLAKMPVMSKPYHLATVQDYLEKIKTDYPELYRRINSYISRYRQKSNITTFGIEASYSDFDHKNIPNQRGQTSASNFKGEVAGYWQLSDNINLSVGGIVYDGSGGIIPNHTYLSYVHDYFQIDVGYKEIWLNPFQESSSQLSTNAKPIARFSISSPKPLTDYLIEYDVAFGELEEMEGIRFGSERTSGQPGFISVHLGAQFVDWWTLGLNRTMMFGGGGRDVGFSEVWDAFIDPVNSDNCGGTSELQNCDEEFGNQQAGISSKFDIDIGIPLQVYFEYTGEDTNKERAYRLGNRVEAIGVFFPYLTDQSSLLIEHQSFQNAWYTHHLYQEGYRNEMNTIGHWWGDEKLIEDPIGAEITTIRYNHEINDQFHFDVKFATYNNKNISNEAPSDESIYEQGNELTLGLNQVEKNSIWRYEVYTGNDAFGENFTRLSIKYSWQ